MEGFPMARCLKAVVALMAAGFLVFSSNADPINLTGTVKDSATQQVISGAIVSLAKQNPSDTTDANGAYTLAGTTGVRFPGGVQNGLLHAPIFKQNVLKFGVASVSERVRIDVYNVSGQRVSCLLDREIGSGNYQINPYLATLASQIYFVKIQIGSQSSMFTMPLSNKLAATSGGILRRTGGTENGSLAKTAAGIDTIIVKAAGYKQTKAAISSYTGSNDIILPRVGPAIGFVTFDNASYSGCQRRAVIIVNDTDLTGATATVSVHVRSNADTVGFMLSLRKDPTTFCNYFDSLGFSIVKSDSTKRILKVQDMGSGDVLTVVYHDLSPDTMLSMTGITWNGTTGQVGPGASIYAGLTVKEI